MAEIGNEPFLKRVYFGVGKVVEQHRPQAWEKLFLRILDEKIMPKLDEGDQAWFIRLRPKVERIARFFGVATTAAEITAVVAGGVGVGKAIQKIPELPTMIRKWRFRGVIKGEGGMPDMPFMWAKKPLSKSLEVVAKMHASSLARERPFTDWLAKTKEFYIKNFGEGGAKQFAETIRVMYERASNQGAGGTGLELQRVYRLAMHGKKDAARAGLAKLFDDAYRTAALRSGRLVADVTPQQKVLQEANASVTAMFQKWQFLDDVGIEGLFKFADYYGEHPQEEIIKAAKKLRVRSQLPIPKFRQILELTGNPFKPYLTDDEAGHILYKIWQPYLSIGSPEYASAGKETFSWAAQMGREVTGDEVRRIVDTGLDTQVKRDAFRHRLHVAARRAPDRIAQAKQAVEQNPAVIAVREQVRDREIQQGAADRLASRAAMGREGMPGVRETARQAGRRLNRVEGRQSLQERVRNYHANEQVKSNVAAKAKQQADWDREKMVMDARREMEADFEQRGRLKNALENAATVRAQREEQTTAAREKLAGDQKFADDLAQEIEDTTVATLQKEGKLVQDVANEAADALRHRQRLITLGSSIDAALAEENPILVADIAAKVATLGTNETSASKELATYLVRISQKPQEYAPLLERLQKVSESPHSGEALSAASALLEKAYNSQKGVKKIDPAFTTKFSTLAAFWAQRLGLVGLADLTTNV